MSLAARLRALVGSRYRNVGPAEAATLIDGGAFLLDVREREEYRAGRAPGSRNLPLGELPALLGNVPADRTVVTVCRSGARSARAAALLARSGYDVVNLAGGMHAWHRAGLPVVANGGRRGRVA